MSLILKPNRLVSVLFYMKQLFFIFLMFTISSCGIAQTKTTSKNTEAKTFEISKSEEEWKSQLSEEEYYVLRKKGTERAFTGKFYDHHEDGVYTCGACNTPLFSSETKFESGSGWPSFYDVMDKLNILVGEDNSFGMQRDEVVCGKCGGHLGHVFNDGPKPTGLRYCINSVSLNFTKAKD